MADLLKHPEETELEYHKRLVYGKLVDKSLVDVDYEELSPYVFGKDYNSDVARRMMYGSRYTLELIDNQLNGNSSLVKNRILNLSDFHVPYNLPVSTFKEYAGRVDTLVLNGDIVDMRQISKFPKLYRTSPMEELIEGRQFLIDLIKMLRPKKVYINYGNHEKRWGLYLAKSLDTDITDLMPDTALDLIIVDGFSRYDWEKGTKIKYEPLQKIFEDIEIIYTGNWWVKIGKTIFAHPYTFSSGMLKTTEKAVDYFLRVEKDFDTVCLGHTHRLGFFEQGSISLYEQGACCCIEKVNYSDGKLVLPQQKGFMYLCQDAEGSLIKSQTKLISID